MFSRCTDSSQHLITPDTEPADLHDLHVDDQVDDLDHAICPSYETFFCGKLSCETENDGNDSNHCIVAIALLQQQ